VSQLAETLVLLGHESDAAAMQEALDSRVKGFVAAAEDLLSRPAPPATAAQAARDAAHQGAEELQHKLYVLRKATWKWDLLRPVDIAPCVPK
jgi:hypothetical protein